VECDKLLQWYFNLGDKMTGLEIWNSSGTLQVDSSNISYYNIWKGTYTTGSGSINYTPTVYSTSLTLTGTPTQISAFRCDTAHIALYNVTYNYSNNTYLFTIYADQPNATFYVYNFDIVPYSSSGQGLQVFNGSGQTVFSSGYSPIIIRDVIEPSGAFTNDYDSGRNYAALFSYRVGSCVTYSTNATHPNLDSVQETIILIRNLGGAISGTTSSGIVLSETTWGLASTIMVVDVTNL
jgi:hypothetical protein